MPRSREANAARMREQREAERHEASYRQANAARMRGQREGGEKEVTSATGGAPKGDWADAQEHAGAQDVNIGKHLVASLVHSCAGVALVALEGEPLDLHQ